MARGRLDGRVARLEATRARPSDCDCPVRLVTGDGEGPGPACARPPCPRCGGPGRVLEVVEVVVDERGDECPTAEHSGRHPEAAP